METETQSTRPAPQLRPSEYYPEQLDLEVWTCARNSRVVRMTEDELQAIVQAAYDQHGILAAPSWHTEAQRGRCQCSQPGCSDAGVEA